MKKNIMILILMVFSIIVSVSAQTTTNKKDLGNVYGIDRTLAQEYFANLYDPTQTGVRYGEFGGFDQGMPVVLLHGYNQDKQDMVLVEDWIQEAYPGTYVHHFSLTVQEKEKEASMKWSLERQVEKLCQDVCVNPKLSPGFNFVGFGQGALIARIYVEKRCCIYPAHNIISFGAPHGGVFVQEQFTTTTTSSRTLPLNKDPLQNHLNDGILEEGNVLSSYWRNPYDLETYETFSPLAKYNNEVEHEVFREDSYAWLLMNIHHLVLIRSTFPFMQHDDCPDIMSKEECLMYQQDPQSSLSHWFGQYQLTSNNKLEMVPLHESTLFKEDWIGLNAMEQLDQLHFYASSTCSLASFHTESCKEVFFEYAIPFLNKECHTFGVEFSGQYFYPV